MTRWFSSVWKETRSFTKTICGTGEKSGKSSLRSAKPQAFEQSIMARTKFIAGNWKMNTTKASAIELAKALVAGAPLDLQIGVAPPFVYLDAVGSTLASSRIFLGAQDVYFEKNGAFTGEISIDMLKDRFAGQPARNQPFTKGSRSPSITPCTSLVSTPVRKSFTIRYG